MSLSTSAIHAVCTPFTARRFRCMLARIPRLFRPVSQLLVSRPIAMASSSTSATATASGARQIQLNETEQRFVRLLDDFASRQQPPVECRIAGGWVRDKLLSLPSHDLDIALSIPSGYEFAASFVDYLKGQDVATGSVGRVAANPEQSKHLETGTTRIMGLECDFVGLRSETYTDSRIPDQKLGTPLEDASRRDLTVNALFYNVHTQQVEDHTEKGLLDLEHRIARTPLPPRQTFFDDPLRVIRCVRFAARFGLAIADDVSAAIEDPEVQAALRSKVSKERVGIELSKMMSPSKDPIRAISLIDELSLHASIFVSPLDVDPPRHDALRAAQVLAAVSQRVETWGKPFRVADFHWFAAALVPFRGMTHQGKKPVPAVSAVMAESLKLSNDVNKAVTNLYAAPAIFHPGLEVRSDIGVAMQNSAVRPWERSLVWGAVDEILPEWQGSWDASADATLARWADFKQRIERLGLPKDHDLPPLLDGKQLQALLSLKPGPLIQVVLQAVNVWRLDHPTATQQDCSEWVQSMWEGEGKREWESRIPAPQVKDKAEKQKKKRRLSTEK